MPTAYILSPMVNINLESCLHLVYYSVGSMVNTLSLYIQTQDNFLTSLYSELIHSHKIWHALHLTVPAGTYRIVFVGERDKANQKTILIDNVSLLNGGCTVACKF